MPHQHETSARLAVVNAIASVTGGSWLPEDLLRHAAQSSAVPADWGLPQMQAVLDGMVADKLIATDRGHYFVAGGVLLPLSELQTGQVG
jgi:hypothetical protein